MLAAGERHPFRGGHVYHFVQRFQPLAEHRALAGDVRLQRVRRLCRSGELRYLLQAQVDFLQRRLPVQYLACRLLLAVSADKQPLCHANNTIFVGAQFKARPARFVLPVHQPAFTELRFAVFGGQVNVLFTPFIFHKQFVLRGRAQDIAAAVSGH